MLVAVVKVMYINKWLAGLNTGKNDGGCDEERTVIHGSANMT